jgi:hypothetical protein
MAEISNPGLIIRTGLRILDKKDTPLYWYNDLIFAIMFIGNRVFLCPFFMVWMYEGENILF